MSEDERTISARPSPEDAAEASLRPQTLAVRAVQCVDRMIAVGDEAGAAIDAFCRAAGLDAPHAAAAVSRGENYKSVANG